MRYSKKAEQALSNAEYRKFSSLGMACPKCKRRISGEYDALGTDIYWFRAGISNPYDVLRQDAGPSEAWCLTCFPRAGWVAGGGIYE